MAFITDKIIYLATPKTASRSTVAALRSAFPAGIETKQHHVTPNEVHKYLNGERTLWTCLRNPFTQALSWFYHVQSRKYPRNYQGFLRFVENYTNGRLLEGRLNIYSAEFPGLVRHFLFEKGIESFLESIGAANTSVPHVGNGNTDHSLLTEEAIERIRRRFPKDVELYARIYRETVGGHPIPFGFTAEEVGEK